MPKLLSSNTKNQINIAFVLRGGCNAQMSSISLRFPLKLLSTVGYQLNNPSSGNVYYRMMGRIMFEASCLSYRNHQRLNPSSIGIRISFLLMAGFTNGSLYLARTQSLLGTKLSTSIAFSSFLYSLSTSSSKANPEKLDAAYRPPQEVLHSTPELSGSGREVTLYRKQEAVSIQDLLDP